MKWDYPEFLIHCDDPQTYGKISLFVDREDFRKDIKNAKNKLGIERYIKDVLSIDEKSLLNKRAIRLLKTVKKNYSDKFLVPVERLKMILEIGIWAKHPQLQDSQNLKLENFKINRETNLIKGILRETIFLLEKYKKSYSYYEVILSCIIGKDIITENFRPATTYDGSDLLNNPDKENVYKNTSFIAFGPETTIGDITLAFNKYKKWKKSKYKNTTPFSDTISNIMRDRVWYWVHKDGKSYRNIWTKTPSQFRPATRDGVIKAIRQYERKLGV